MVRWVTRYMLWLFTRINSYKKGILLISPFSYKWGRKCWSLPTTLDEAKHAIFDINGDSSTDPDDLTDTFYQACRDIAGNNLLRMFIDFFYGNTLSKSITYTDLVLLPKREIIPSFVRLCMIGWKLCYLNWFLTISLFVKGRISLKKMSC